MIVKRATLLNEPCTESATLPQKWVKGDLHVFHQNVGDYPYLKKNIFPFLNVEPFGYDKTPNEDTVTFWTKFGAISPSP